MKTGKIKYIDADGEWNGLQKFKVTFADGERFTFFSKGNFKGNIGDEIKFEVSNAERGTAKLIRENSFNTPNQVGGATSKDELIMRQTCIKASAEFNAKRENSSSDTVIEDAEKWFNWLTS